MIRHVLRKVEQIIAPNSAKQHQSYLCDEGEPHYEVDDKQHGNKQLPVLP